MGTGYGITKKYALILAGLSISQTHMVASSAYVIVVLIKGQDLRD